MDTSERGVWCLWTLSLLTQSLFLVATQTASPGSSIIWATGTPAVTIALIAIVIATFEYWPTWREALVTLLFVSVVPTLTLAVLTLNDVLWIVSWAAFLALCAGLMAAWAVFDILVLKPHPTTESFDVVNDAAHNSGV